MTKKDGKFSKEFEEFLETIVAEKKGELRKIAIALLRSAHEAGAHLEFSGPEPEGFMDWIDARIEEREKAKEENDNSNEEGE